MLRKDGDGDNPGIVTLPDSGKRTTVVPVQPSDVPTKDESRQVFIPDGLRFASLQTVLDYFERQVLIDAVSEQFGQFFQDKFLFCHFITVTLRRYYRDGRPVPAGRGRLRSAWSFIRKLIRKLNQGIEPSGIGVLEFQSDGTPHLHLLTTNTVALIGNERTVEDEAWTKYGKCQVLRYRPKVGATYYLSKYLAKDSRLELFAIGRLGQYRLPRKQTDRDDAADQVDRRQRQATLQAPA
jgi:hypothetical protein